MTVMIQLAIGLAGSMIIAGLAYARRSLSGSGFIAAVVLGTAMYTVSNLVWFGSLIAFFISSSALSKVKAKRKREAEQHYEKGGRRDAGQVAANGAVPLILAVGFSLLPHAAWWYGFIGALAAVNADTWATELGALSKSKPRSIVTGKRVEPGTSGGVTVAGLAASGLGGCFIGLSAFLLSSISGIGAGHGAASLADGLGMLTAAGWNTGLSWIWVGGVAGLAGSLIDSWIGASVQAVYRCDDCGRIVERDEHCGVQARHVRGWRMMRNDQVNALASICGAVTAVIIGLWI